MRDEGYIKFDCHRAKIPLTIPEPYFSELNYWRDQLYSLGLIGAYPDGIGYGNISVRDGYSREFWITGSATGNLAKLSKENYARVTDFDLANNRVWCWGDTKASSESMSHAVLYYCDQRIKAVVHVHHAALWKHLMFKVPTTAADIPYGTYEMAKAVQKLYKTTDLPEQKILVMAGHEEGIITFGESLAAATKLIINQLKLLHAK